MSATTTNAQAALRTYVSRIERTQEQIDDLNTDKSEIYKEAKNEGFDVKVLKAVVAYRRKVEKQGADVIQEFDSVFELYLHALEGVGTEDATRARAQDETHSAGATPSPSPADKGRAHPPVAPAPANFASEAELEQHRVPSPENAGSSPAGGATGPSAAADMAGGGPQQPDAANEGGDDVTASKASGSPDPSRPPSPPSAADFDEIRDMPDFLKQRKEHA